MKALRVTEFDTVEGFDFVKSVSSFLKLLDRNHNRALLRIYDDANYFFDPCLEVKKVDDGYQINLYSLDKYGFKKNTAYSLGTTKHDRELSPALRVQLDKYCASTDRESLIEKKYGVLSSGEATTMQDKKLALEYLNRVCKTAKKDIAINLLIFSLMLALFPIGILQFLIVVKHAGFLLSALSLLFGASIEFLGYKLLANDLRTDETTIYKIIKTLKFYYLFKGKTKQLEKKIGKKELKSASQSPIQAQKEEKVKNDRIILEGNNKKYQNELLNDIDMLRERTKELSGSNREIILTKLSAIYDEYVRDIDRSNNGTIAGERVPTNGKQAIIRNTYDKLWVLKEDIDKMLLNKEKTISDREKLKHDLERDLAELKKAKEAQENGKVATGGHNR